MRHTIFATGLSLFVAMAMAEAESSGGTEDAAMKAQNPLANIISMPLQWNTEVDIGPDDDTGYTLNIQPIYPVSLDNGMTLINRAIVPLPKSVPAGGPDGDRETGLGDTTMMNWFSPDPKGAFMWGAGPVTVWPTATDDRLGKQPLDITAQYYNYVEKPDGGPEWMFRLQLKFIFPKSKEGSNHEMELG